MSKQKQNHAIRGSGYIVRKKVQHLGKLDDNHEITTTWILNRNLDKYQLDNCIKEITTFCKTHNLTILSNFSYHLKIKGTSLNFAHALQVQINKYQNNDDIYHASLSPIKIPIQLKGKVVNIIGLNNEKIAHPYFKKLDTKNLPRALTTFNPLQLATLYNFPTNLDGTGQKIGIIELGGGFVLSDVTTYFSMLNIPYTPKITTVSVDGATNNPNDGSGANIEVILDTEIIAAIAPNASIFVYFAPNSYQGFYNAINTAINGGCNIISISWGAAERFWSSSVLSSYNSLFQYAATQNVTIFAASGDNGSSDGTTGLNVDFPASSPYVVGCGGTNVKTTDNVTISQETVWNVSPTSSATGGGISSFFPKPDYQANVPYPLNNKRGVPDVSGDADPNTGYVVYSAREGGTIVIGGTSAVSPLWSGLLGRINQSIGRAVGFLHPTLYSNPQVCRDITQGNNGAYSANAGWDPCTGYGSPNGVLLLNLLSNKNPPIAGFGDSPISGNAPLTVQFTDQSTGSPTSWFWSFGDASTSTLQNPTHTYLAAGVYTVSLTVSNAGGSSIITKPNYVTVTNPPPAPPVAAFIGFPLTGNAPLVVQFTDQSSGSPTIWLYNFGDGTTSTLQNPTHTYQTAGVYTVSLAVWNAGGVNNLTKPNYITVTNTLPPVSAFIASPLSGTAPLIVQFTDQSTGSPIAWLWAFDDGSNSTLQNPSHTYLSPGVYTVSLAVWNAGGVNNLTKPNYITVNASLPPPPVAAFTASPLSGVAPLKVQLIDQSKGSPTKFFWNLGDNSSSTIKNALHTYRNAGKYTVSLTASNNRGASKLVKTNYITVANPRHIFNKSGKYNVMSTVTDSKGSNSTVKKNYISVV